MRETFIKMRETFIKMRETFIETPKSFFVMRGCLGSSDIRPKNYRLLRVFEAVCILRVFEAVCIMFEKVWEFALRVCHSPS